MRRLSQLFFILLLSVLSACGGGGGGDAATPGPTPTPAPVVGSIKGTAFATDTAAPLANTKVSVGDIATTTANDGSFTLNNVPVAERAVVKFEATDYAPAFSAVAVVDKQTSTTQGLLNKVGATSTFAANTASTITVPNSPAQVALVADSIVNAATGAAPSGAITAKITPIDPASNPQSMPGDYTSLTAAGAVQSIESFGAVNVELKDAAGNKLNLAQGKSATIRIPVSSRTAAANNPATIPLYYFNETNGRWVQEGTATLSADKQYYEGTVTHFSTWNCDRPLDETIFVTGCVVDLIKKTGVNGALVTSTGVDYSGLGITTTDSVGNFRVAMKKNGVANIQAQTPQVGGGIFYSNIVTVGPSSVDIALPACQVMSDVIDYTPTIVLQPVDVTSVEGEPATFYGFAYCTTVAKFQWYRNGVLIPGATQYFYSHTALLDDNGAKYTFVITCAVPNNPAGASVTSNPATLTVVPPPPQLPPTITTQPQSQTIFQGLTVSFFVVATGSQPLTYQWYKNGVAIANTNSPIYITPAAATTDNGAVYSVTATNPYGSATSNNATLTVQAVSAPPVITRQPANAAVYLGQQAIFSVIASDPLINKYQWLRNGVVIAGATGNIYLTPAVTAADNGARYSVTVSNIAGSVTSAEAVLTVSLTSVADIEAINRLINLPFEFGGVSAAATELTDDQFRVLPAASVCATGSSSGTFDGATLPAAGTQLPLGTHTLSASYTNCAPPGGTTTTSGSSSITYNVNDPLLLNGSFTTSSTNLRVIDSGSGSNNRDVTANGGATIALSGQLVNNIETASSSYTPANGATLKNNTTNNLATFTSGSVTIKSVTAIAATGVRTPQQIRQDFNSASYSIGATNYVVTGFLQFTLNVQGQSSGEVIVKANGVQVGRAYVDVNGQPVYEANGAIPVFSLPAFPGKLFGRAAMSQ
jgi:Immunoglobulin domain